MYEPALLRLKPTLPAPLQLTILDQGQEGACTGFGLAAVINLLNRQRNRRVRVSPRMLYEMARRFDEWPGEDYSGSSCRGTIRGWYNMGVCSEPRWPYEVDETSVLTLERAKEARNNTIGAYYRLRSIISDVHAALNEVGVIYVSANVHEGWQGDGLQDGEITFRPGSIGGHAFAIVGYDERGFMVQNSWGSDWGRGGLARWTYEDWHANVRDAWVVRLALPTPQIFGVASSSYVPASDSRSGAPTPTRAEIAGHFVHIDDGQFDDNGQYWSNLSDVEITAANLSANQKYPHLLFYAHGGLNDPKGSARRISAMKEVFKANGIYPYHFMYDTGLLEELKDILLGKRDETIGRVGNIFTDASDRAIEYVAQRPGRAIWREMKRDAETPFVAAGAGSFTLNAFRHSLQTRSIHIVGHSTGAVFLGHLLSALGRLGVPGRVASCSLMAPACSVSFFQSHYEPLLRAQAAAFGIDSLHIYNLSDKLEKDDSVGPYRKSLLYLVSKAFEEERNTPLLGMQRDIGEIEGQVPRLLVNYSVGHGTGANPDTSSEAHGGFDNDLATMNHVLQRMLGGNTPSRPFEVSDLMY